MFLIVFIRFFKFTDKVSDEDFIGKYFYSEVDKEWLLESTWHYKDYKKRVELVGIEKFADELFDYFQNGKLNHKTLFLSKRIETFESKYEGIKYFE